MEDVQGAAARGQFTDLLSRRQVLKRASVLSLGGLVLSALPAAERILETVAPAQAATLTDATLQAFADTIIPGRKASLTDLGDQIDPRAIAGAHSEPGAVQTDALEPAFLADLESRSLLQGGQFIDLPFAKRVAVCVQGLAPSNPSVQVWEAAAAIPFTAFCAAAMVPNATAAKASGYRVMGLPGVAPKGYPHFSYRKKLSRERTKRGSLA